jgi:hypothetical protein
MKRGGLTLYNEGVKSLSEGSLEDAEAHFLEALKLMPGFREALVNLAFVQDARGDLVAAEKTYGCALEAGANHFELHLNLGALLAGLKRFDEAERSYMRAMDVDAQSSALWSNLGATYLAIHRDDDAYMCLSKALEFEPENAKAKFNLAYLHLLRGNFREGWAYLESRDWYQGFQRVFDFPRWKGEALVNRRIVVCYEAGMGDVIQFSRYIDELREMGASHITLVCHPPLKTLMSTLKSCSRVIGFDEDVSGLNADYWTPLMSIPFYLGTDAHSIPAKIPYLSTHAALVQSWGEHVPVGSIRVGLAWRGNPRFENDSERSLPHFRSLLPLWAVPGVRFVSLQKGQGEEEVGQEADNQPAISLGSEAKDFADIAAIIANLDLVITVDTAVAHVAGALGKDCWVLLPYCMTDWRWLREGDRSAWYPLGMRLFRQRHMGNWSDTVDEVAVALETFVSTMAHEG